jgi:hypothetical protein
MAHRGERRGRHDPGFPPEYLESETKEVCEVALLKEGAGSLNVQIATTVSQNGQECRLIMVEITKRRRIDNTQEVLATGRRSQNLNEAGVLAMNI